MPVIILKFKDQPKLYLDIDNHTVGQQYFNLVQQNYNTILPIFRDRKKYSIEYMFELATKAKQLLGWNWEVEKYSIENTPSLHKDLEELAGITGFKTVPAEYDDLLHEIHYCLHIIQYEHYTRQNGRIGWLQLEWYNDRILPLDPTFKFTTNLKFGDIKLQNPWVGHGPLQVYLEKDFTKISQTCKFHDSIRPGINILTTDLPPFDEAEQLIKIFKIHDLAFVEKHGVEKILHYTGHPVVGRVRNLLDLQTIIDSPLLEFESLEFNE
jgi:hypothetical protein